ncbi:MAG: ATP-grasp domain-containing protein [Bacteroidetes bacterium]|nr:ATP-grasp domain-containing protein [Bacteroidota bacterium]
MMSSAPVHILFLGGAKRVSLAEHLIQSGKEKGIPVHIYSYELNKEVPISETATILEGRRWADPGLLAHLEKCIRDHQIRMVIPFVDPATVVASELKKRIPELFIPASPAEISRLFFSKIKTQKWCIENHIPVPQETQSEFPLIAKPDAGSASKGIEILTDQNALVLFLESHSGEEYLIQKYVRATEYTVDAYRSITDGTICYMVPRIRLEVQGGEAIKSRTVRYPEMEELSRKIIEKAGLYGAITLQFLEENGSRQIYFMEVNPRFGGGVVTGLGAGLDIFNCLLTDAAGEPGKEQSWEDNVLMMRRFKEIYIHANHH